MRLASLPWILPVHVRRAEIDHFCHDLTSM
jgi:hypothetical protein